MIDIVFLNRVILKISTYIEDFLHLKKVVNTLGMKLKLELVSDLLETVFPVHFMKEVLFYFSYFK
jgi:hypothetical protein